MVVPALGWGSELAAACLGLWQGCFGFPASQLCLASPSSYWNWLHCSLWSQGQSEGPRRASTLKFCNRFCVWKLKASLCLSFLLLSHLGSWVGVYLRHLLNTTLRKGKCKILPRFTHKEALHRPQVSQALILLHRHDLKSSSHPSMGWVIKALQLQ